MSVNAAKVFMEQVAEWIALLSRSLSAVNKLS
jgi:hypothetical protein